MRYECGREQSAAHYPHYGRFYGHTKSVVALFTEMMVGKDGNYLITVRRKATGIYWSQGDYQHLTWLKVPQFVCFNDHPDLVRISIKSASKVSKAVSFLDHINGDFLCLEKRTSLLFDERTLVFAAPERETTCPHGGQTKAEKGKQQDSDSTYCSYLFDALPPSAPGMLSGRKPHKFSLAPFYL